MKKINFKTNECIINIFSKKKIKFFKLKNNFLVVIFGEILDKKNKKIKIQDLIKKISLVDYNNNFLAKEILKNYFGSFGLFFYNFKKKNCFFLNDRFGLTHLFYQLKKYKNKYSLKISDDIDSLLNLKKDIDSINENFVKEYLLCRYDDIYGKKRTIYKNINFLKASNIKIFDFKNKKTKNFCYCNFQKQKLNKNITFNDALKILDSKILNSIKDLNFDKTNSIIAVSGGMDSTTTCYYLNKLNIKIPSFTVSYDVTTQLNEFSEAKIVANKYCKNWIRLNIDHKTFLRYWKKCYEYHAQPLPTSSCLGYDIIFDKISNLGYKNIINSGSSDDLFGSNFPGFLYNLSDLYFDDKYRFHKEFKLWIKNYSTKSFPKNFNVFKKFFKKNIYNRKEIAPDYQLVNNDRKSLKNFKKESIRSHSLHHAWILYGMWFCGRPANSIPMKEGEIKFKLNSIDPYLDKDLINFVWQLPSNYKINDGNGKYILRKLMDKRLPSKITKNYIKTGFDVPIKKWLMKKDFKKFVLNNIDDNNPILKKLINIKKFKKEIYNNNPDINPMFLWQVTNFCLWLKYKKTRCTD